MAWKVKSPSWSCWALVLLTTSCCFNFGGAASFHPGMDAASASLKHPARAASDANLAEDWSNPSYLELLARVGEAAEHRLLKNELKDTLSHDMVEDPVETFRLKYSTPLSRDKSSSLHAEDVSSLRTPHGAGSREGIMQDLATENDDVEGDYLGYAQPPYSAPPSPLDVVSRRPSNNVQPFTSVSSGFDALSPQCSPCGPPPCPIPCYYPVPVYTLMRRPTPPPAPAPTTTSTTTTTTTTTTTAAPATASPEHQRPPPYVAPPVPWEMPCVEIPICIQYLINLASIVFGIWLLKWYCSTMAAFDQECGLDDRAHGGTGGNDGAFRGLSTTQSSFVSPPFATISAYYDPATNQVVLPQEYQPQQQQYKYTY